MFVFNLKELNTEEYWKYYKYTFYQQKKNYKLN